MGKGKAPGSNGYHYSFGIHMGMGRGPVDALVEIRVGDKTAWKGSVSDSRTISIDEPDLFGGNKSEGGIVGDFTVMMGEADQVAPNGLVRMVGHGLPGFRRMFTAFYDGRICSNNPYPKAWKFRVRRALKGWESGTPWYPEKCVIDLVGDPDRDNNGAAKPSKNYKLNMDRDGEPYEGDEYEAPTFDVSIKAMNGAHIIYEVMTNREWGRGLPPAALDDAAFRKAADALFDEGFGLCLRWSRRDSLEAFIKSVLDHIGAVIYSDRETSLIKLVLIRKDYDAKDLPIYDTDSGILEIRAADVSALGSGVNEIVVEYTDPISNKVRTVSNQNLASLQSTRGVFNSLKKTYNGVPTADLALRLAQRDLRINAMALRRFTITFDRRAWRIPPAGVIRIRDLARGIQDVTVRVGRIEDGTLTDGTITITAVQDVFALPSASFIANEPPNSVMPNNKPELKEHRAFEVPYFLLNASMKPADFAYVKDDAGYLGTVVAKPTDLSMAYNLYVRSGAPTEDDYPTP